MRIPGGANTMGADVIRVVEQRAEAFVSFSGELITFETKDESGRDK